VIANGRVEGDVLIRCVAEETRLDVAKAEEAREAEAVEGHAQAPLEPRVGEPEHDKRQPPERVQRHVPRKVNVPFGSG